MKNDSDQWQVEDELLTETGRGGLFTDGYLQGRPLVSYLEDSETPLFVFGSGKRGITRTGPDGTTEYTPGSGYRAIIALTDRRVKFVVGGSDGDWAADIHLTNVEAVEVESGLLREELSITAGDVEWQVPLTDIDTDRLVEFLEEVSWSWIRVERLLDEARTHLADANRHQKAREHEAAAEQLGTAREQLDEAAGITDALADEATTGMREHLGGVERRYRETRRRVAASRAASVVDEAEEHWRADEYQQAFEAFIRARDRYEAALDIEGLDPDTRRSMRDRIEHVERNLDHLRAAPLKRAAQVRRRALEAEDPAERIEAWSEAIERYRTVLELDWGGDERRFAGDVDRCRDRVAEAVDGVLDARKTLAADWRDHGDDLIEAGDPSGARDQYAEAVSNLEAALDLARELAPDRAESIQERLEALADRIDDATAAVGTDEESDSENVDEDAEADEDDPWDEWETPTRTDRDDSGAPTGGTDDGDQGASDFDDWVTLTPESEPTASGEASTGGGAAIDPQEAARQSMSPRDEGKSLQRSPLSDSDLVASVESLTSGALASLVSAVWDQRGWTTEASDVDDVVLASRASPDERRVLVAAPDATPTSVDRARRARVAFEADHAALFVTESLDRCLDQPHITLYDAADTATLVEQSDLVSLLRNVTV